MKKQVLVGRVVGELAVKTMGMERWMNDELRATIEKPDPSHRTIVNRQSTLGVANE